MIMSFSCQFQTTAKSRLLPPPGQVVHCDSLCRHFTLRRRTIGGSLGRAGFWHEFAPSYLLLDQKRQLTIGRIEPSLIVRATTNRALICPTHLSRSICQQFAFRTAAFCRDLASCLIVDYRASHFPSSSNHSILPGCGICYWSFGNFYPILP